MQHGDCQQYMTDHGQLAQRVSQCYGGDTGYKI